MIPTLFRFGPKMATTITPANINELSDSEFVRIILMKNQWKQLDKDSDTWSEFEQALFDRIAYIHKNYYSNPSVVISTITLLFNILEKEIPDLCFSD